MSTPSKVKALSLALLIGLSGSAWAGLGNVKVYSYLGEPFYATIPLTGQTAKDAVSPTLTQESDLARIQVKGSYAANALEFKIVRNKNGQAFVQVRSRAPINEPILTFGVNVQSASGTVSRQYSAMLDPRGTYIPPKKTQVNDNIAPYNANTSTAEKRVAAANSYTLRVSEGDTLHSIASQYKPARLSLANTKRAIYLANPKAFARGSSEKILVGATIRIPSEARMRTLLASANKPKTSKPAPTKQASSAKPAAATAPSTVTAATDAASAKEVNALKQNVQKTKADLDNAQKTIKELQAQINAAKKTGGDVQKLNVELSKANSERDRFKTQLAQSESELKAQLAEKNKQLEQTNKQLAEAKQKIDTLQQQLTAAEQEAKTAPAAPAVTEPTPAELPAQVEEPPATNVASAETIVSDTEEVSEVDTVASAEEASAEEIVSIEEVSEEEVVVTPPAAPVDIPPVSEPSFLDTLMEKLPLIGGGLVAILALVGGFVWFKRRGNKAIPDEDYEESGETFFSMPTPVTGDSLSKGFDTPAIPPAVSTQANNVVAAGQRAQDAFTQINPSALGQGVGPEGSSSTQQASSTFMSDFTRMSAAIDTGEIDPLSEAEVYIAYGRNDEAEEILKDALAKDPAQHEVRKKLLEIYANKQELLPFANMAKELYDAFDGRGALWQEVAAMGRKIDPTNPLYRQSDNNAAPTAAVAPAPRAVEVPPVASAPVVETEEDALEKARAFDEAFEISEPEPQVAQPEQSPLSNDLDFDFSGLDISPASSSTTQETVTGGYDSAAGLEFDLDAVLDDAKDAGTLDEPTPEIENISLDISEPAATTSGYDSNDPAAAKLELAKVYLDMGDIDGAREALIELLDEVENPALIQEAESMLAKLNP
ncbi:FimV/HubP family polar landmark protein [Neisseria sp. Ec49-e6-T10]|uniref:FimV/HubP family polar landmark protein n=1 Tax=Neisseria sp. Ec49-e6-T10 TaxID=3140744 RepID=UPI003EC05593